MLVELTVSLFGTAIIYRNLSLIESLEVIRPQKLHLIFWFLQLPLCFYLFFKEHVVPVIIYIGIFSLTLILHHKIIAYFEEKTFEKLHFHIVERVILLVNTGKSASASVKVVFSELNNWEKRIFLDLAVIFEIKNTVFETKNGKKPARSAFRDDYFRELKTILHLPVHLAEQLRSFREALRLQNNLRHRSRQALQQTRAQAVVAIAIYVTFFAISVRYLQLEVFSLPVAASAALFTAGQIIIFWIGGVIQWKS